MPPLPTVRELAAMFRRTHKAFCHPECGEGIVYLTCEGAGWPDAHWTLESFPEGWPHAKNGEHVPGTPGLRFDAIGAARRCLASARDEGWS